jgi:hypothetical protein
MKKSMSLIPVLLMLFIASSFAKKVKFSVDMTGQIVSANGVHVMGDFQSVAGFGADWTPNTTLLVQDVTDTNIYSIVVDIPAFVKYEYKYTNGDQSYEVEIVPEESRANFNFSDNRWLYVDSLANDTTDIGAIVFGMNAPKGLALIRYKVDMQGVSTISPNGVHVAANYQGMNPATDRMYSFSNNIYELINYINTGSVEYKYYNGNTSSDAEIIPANCTVNSNREVTISADKVLDSYCFATCSICFPTSVSDVKNVSIKIYPNPANEFIQIEASNAIETSIIKIQDLQGRLVLSQYINHTNSKINISSLNPGIYVLKIGQSNSHSSFKLIKE